MRTIDADALMERLGIAKDCDDCRHQKRRYCCVKDNDFIYACAAIVGAPTVQPEPQWIPCSERLPKEWDNVLVCNENTVCECYFVQGKFCCVQSAVAMKVGMIELADAIAWLPLPEPYKGE